MPGPVIVAHEPARGDAAPAEFALAVARDSGAPVIAASVLELIDAAGPYGDRAARQTLDESLAHLHDALGVETRALVDLSVPHAIHRLAEDEGAELVVLGATDRGPIGRIVPGSTAERLIHGAHCTVALVPPDWAERPIEAIAVGFVDTPEGNAALRTAHRIALRTAARLRCLAVVHPITGVDTMAAAELRPERLATLQGRARAELQAAAVGALRALGPEGDVEIHVDDPADVLLRASEHVDLVVCGSRAYGPLRAVVLGSVSRRVVDGARCPVLVVPRGVEHPLEGLLPLRTAERT